MLSLQQSARLDDGQVSVLPDVWRSLRQAGIAFRRGQVAMVAGAPGNGKTLLALVYALRVRVPTVYVCADTDRHTMTMRAASAITGHPYERVEQAFATSGREFYADELSEADHVRWCFDSAPTLEDISDELACYVELYGSPPELVVIDNLTSLTLEGDEWGGLRAGMKQLLQLARKSDAAVMLLHHTSEQHVGEAHMPPPRRFVQGKVSQLPELILTVALDPSGWLRVAAVKNRSGPGDASASNPVVLRCEPASMRLEDMNVQVFHA